MDVRTGFNIAYFIACVHAMCILPFTRSGMGTRGIDATGFWALLLIAFYTGEMHCPEMLTYWYVWVVMVVYRRLTTDKRQHTQFEGWVWPFQWIVRNEVIAKWLEALSMLILGTLFKKWSEPVGQFLFYGFFSLGFKCVIEGMHRARQKEAAHNARFEMLATQRRFQEDQHR